MAYTILHGDEITQAIEFMANQLLLRSGDSPWAIVGIRSGGEALSLRLAKAMEAKLNKEVVHGSVDITLYRDDGFGPNDWPDVGETSLPFNVKDYTVVLVDDVLYTGRTVRAALDLILDYGRPKAVRLAVLVDRGLRELPVQADVVGKTVETKKEQHVKVVVSENPSPEDMAVVE